MAIKQEIIDELLSDYKNPEDLLGDEGIFKESMVTPARPTQSHSSRPKSWRSNGYHSPRC